jgi:hypothetical protein
LNNNYQGTLSLQVLVQQPWFSRHCAFLGMKDVPSSASTLKNATPQLKNCWYYYFSLSLFRFIVKKKKN